MLLRLFVVLCVFAAPMFLAQPALAEVSIAVVDVDRVMNEADAAKKLQKKRGAAREKFLKELSKKEQKLGEEGKAIFEKRGELSEEAFTKERKVYEAKLLEVRQLTQAKKQAFEKASNKSLRLLQDALAEAVRAIAKEKGYTLVLSARNVVTGETSLDITQQALKKINEQTKDIPFEIKK